MNSSGSENIFGFEKPNWFGYVWPKIVPYKNVCVMTDFHWKGQIKAKFSKKICWNTESKFYKKNIVSFAQIYPKKILCS